LIGNLNDILAGVPSGAEIIPVEPDPDNAGVGKQNLKYTGVLYVPLA
jgi:hypothetical protein